jgi:hypothetical protein
VRRESTEQAKNRLGFWSEPKRYVNGSVLIQCYAKGINQLLGIDASSLWEILNGVDAPPGTEAVIYESKTETLVFFQRLGDGYVSLDDWNNVDADAMLKSVSENTEAANAKRQRTGISPCITRLKALSRSKNMVLGCGLRQSDASVISPFQTVVPSMRLIDRTSSFPRWRSS